MGLDGPTVESSQVRSSIWAFSEAPNNTRKLEIHSQISIAITAPMDP